MSWVQTQRDTHRPHARPLDDREAGDLLRFFDQRIIELARIRVVPRLENPPFYSSPEARGMPTIDFSQFLGIALIDTILIAEERIEPGPMPLSLIFHELVHVAQYDVVGVEEFIGRYVRGWSRPRPTVPFNPH